MRNNKKTVSRPRGSHGGARQGAGRPGGQGAFGEPTRPVRVPVSLLADIRQWLDQHKQSRSKVADQLIWPAMQPVMQSLPLYANRIPAGFPSPADDYQDNSLDLNEYLVKRPAATFFVRVEGNSMINAGIHEDDVLVVDRSIEPTDGKIVIAVINGELTVKRLSKKGDQLVLMPENSLYKPLHITEAMDFMIWGVVTSVVHQV